MPWYLESEQKSTVCAAIIFQRIYFMILYPQLKTKHILTYELILSVANFMLDILQVSPGSVRQSNIVAIETTMINT